MGCETETLTKKPFGIGFKHLFKAGWWFDYFVVFEVMAIGLTFMLMNEFTMITICGLAIAGAQVLH